MFWMRLDVCTQEKKRTSGAMDAGMHATPRVCGSMDSVELLITPPAVVGFASLTSRPEATHLSFIRNQDDAR